MFLKNFTLLCSIFSAFVFADTLAANIGGSFVYYINYNGAKHPLIKIEAAVQTEEGKSKDVDTWWSGNEGHLNYGSSSTKKGDLVAWSYFYVDEKQTTWGDHNNPDLYVKLWIDNSGRVDVNCFHVSVPDILCGAVLFDTNGNEMPASRATGRATTNNRFVQIRLDNPSSNIERV
jgi:hypothetical protein